VQAKLLHQLIETARAPEGEAPLLDTALAIAMLEYPNLDRQAYRRRLDAWAQTLRRRLPADPGIEERLRALNQFLFTEQGFAGNLENYYDPRNSFINDVIDRRRGIPLTLSIVYIELGRRLGLPLEGVSFPGHFLVRLSMEDGALVLDPFNRGVSLSEEDLDRLLQDVASDRPDDLGRLLAAARKPEIVIRLLRNLKAVYQRDGQTEKALEIVNLILAIDPTQLPEYRDRGLMLTELDCNRAAAADLDHYLTHYPADEDADAIRALIAELAEEPQRLH
jgi:regulator of sirC expression with transglutaminase-like and TPR domain